MGMSLSVKAIYGIKICDDDEQSLDEVLEGLSDSDPDDFLKHKLGDSDVFLESVYYYDNAIHFLTTNVQTGFGGDPLVITNFKKSTSDDDLLKQACKKLKLKYEHPQWYAMAQYF
jgi:hypothetical protein